MISSALYWFGLGLVGTIALGISYWLDSGELSE